MQKLKFVVDCKWGKKCCCVLWCFLEIILLGTEAIFTAPFLVETSEKHRVDFCP
jgi:hypothetical protein